MCVYIYTHTHTHMCVCARAYWFCEILGNTRTCLMPHLNLCEQIPNYNNVSTFLIRLQYPLNSHLRRYSCEPSKFSQLCQQ